MTDDRPLPCRYCGALIASADTLTHLRWHTTVDPDLEEPTSVHGFWTRTGEWIETSR